MAGLEDKTLSSELKPFTDWGSKLITDYVLAMAEKYAKEGRDYYLHEAFTDRKKHFKNFDSETRSMGSALTKEGFREGDTLMYISDDVMELASVYMSVWRLKAIVRACHLEDDDDTLVCFANESKVKYIVCDHRCDEKTLRITKRLDHPCKIIFIGEESETPNGARNLKSYYEDPGDEFPELTPANPDDYVLILCTSGTTGRSKGAIHSHTSLLTMIGLCLAVPFTHPAPNFAVLKSTHVSGSMVPFGFIIDGKSGIITHHKSEEYVHKILEAYQPGTMFCFPTYLSYLLSEAAKNKKLESIETIFSGGAIITSTMKAKLFKRLPKLKAVCVAYGLTETGIITGNFYTNESGEKYVMEDCPSDSVGKLFSEVVLQIRNPETLEILGCGELGELWTKSTMFKGYVNNEKATKESIFGSFFRTGDIGYYDQNGWIYLVDRLKEIFKYAGNHVSPSELENLIQKYDAVAQVSVVGVQEDNDINILPRAWVVLHDKYKNQPNVLQEIADDFNSKVSDYKKLRGGIYVIDKLPEGKTGKIVRKAVEKLNPADFSDNIRYNCKTYC